MSEYEDKQRAVAAKWATAKRQFNQLSVNAARAATERDKQGSIVQALEADLKEFVGANQPTKLYNVDGEIVLVQRVDGAHGAYVSVSLQDFV